MSGSAEFELIEWTILTQIILSYYVKWNLVIKHNLFDDVNGSMWYRIIKIRKQNVNKSECHNYIENYINIISHNYIENCLCWILTYREFILYNYVIYIRI